MILSDHCLVRRSGLAQLVGILSLMLVGIAIPIFAMWGQGQFVGQRQAPAWAQIGILAVIGLALIFGGLRVIASFGPVRDYFDWLQIAWIAGAGVAGFIALEEGMSLRKSKDQP